MKFYCYRGRPVAETLGHFVTWPTWPTKGGDWIEVSKTVLTEAIELSPGEWRKRFKPIECVMDACEHLALWDLGREMAAKRWACWPQLVLPMWMPERPRTDWPLLPSPEIIPSPTIAPK